MKPFFPTLTIALCVLTLVCLWALSVGQFAIPVSEIFALIAAKFGGAASPRLTEMANADVVLFEIRAPRIAAAWLVGAALSAAGAAYQNLFRNPLVSPDILGVSSGAALGAVSGIFLSLPIIAIQGMAFGGGLMAVALILMIGSKLRGHDPMLSLVLTGVVVGSFLASGLSLLKYLADPTNQLPAITYWLMGSFASITSRDVSITALIFVASLTPLFLMRWRMNLLSLPDDEARALGLNVNRNRLVVIVAATLMTATSVSLCGMVGWVGLVVPHVVRLLVGAEFSRLLPLSMIIGGTFMLVVDTLCRTMTQIEIPPGVLTAAIGTPIFLLMMAATLRGKG